VTATPTEHTADHQRRLKEAITSLHRQKDAAYGNSWKRRGELISIMANIARKVDRLEVIASGANPSQDETTLDTAIDLCVYALKYSTYLADQDPAIAAATFAEPRLPSWSDGPAGFERLIADFDMSAMDRRSATTVPGAIRAVLDTFAELEQCFSQPAGSAPPQQRATLAASLATDTLQVVAAVRDENPDTYEEFLTTWQAAPT
jgi:hypothetical protein